MSLNIRSCVFLSDKSGPSLWTKVVHPLSLNLSRTVVLPSGLARPCAACKCLFGVNVMILIKY